jgi:mono/diheme cytochrome c family protein
MLPGRDPSGLSEGCVVSGSLRYTICFLVCAMLSIVVGVSPRAAEPASAVARGEDIARNVCSACHLATSDQEPRRRPPEGPNFTDIANRPETSLKSLRKFIATTHWDMKSMPPTMPNPMLTDAQVSDVSHYIMSLRTASTGK